MDAHADPERVQTLLQLFAESRERVHRIEVDLASLGAAAEGVRRALTALHVEVEGGHSEITGDRLRAELHSILREADPDQRGIHYHDLAQRVEGRGWIIRGRSPAANALAHMSQSPSFRSLGRGIWTWADRQEPGQAP